MADFKCGDEVYFFKSKHGIDNIVQLKDRKIDKGKAIIIAIGYMKNSEFDLFDYPIYNLAFPYKDGFIYMCATKDELYEDERDCIATYKKRIKHLINII